MNNDLMVLPPINSIDSYFNAISKIPVLEKEDEKDLAVLALTDKTAKNKLIYHNLRFCAYMARTFVGYKVPLEDLVQEANMGLLQAIDKFDPERDVRLSSFAAFWIKANLTEYVIKFSAPTKIATTKQQKKLFFNIRRYINHTETNRSLNMNEINQISNDLDVSHDSIIEMEKRMMSHCHSYNHTDHSEDESGYNFTYNVEDTSMMPCEMVEAHKDSEYQSKRLHTAISTLNNREMDIIHSRRLSEEKTTLNDLSSKYNVSKERIRQLENNAVKRLERILVD